MISCCSCRQGCIVSSLCYKNLRLHLIKVHGTSMALGGKKSEVLLDNPQWAPVLDKDTNFVAVIPPLLRAFLPSCPSPTSQTGFRCNHCGDIQDTYNKSRQHFMQQLGLKTPCYLHVGQDPSISFTKCVKVRHSRR
jgi:hypothetical protein